MDVYLIGIKGTGMCSLAGVLKGLGYHVCGSDVKDHFFTDEILRKQNIPVYQFSANNIQVGYDIIVGNAYIESNNEELLRARKLKMPIYTYPQYINKIIKEYNFSLITVAGTHGKTTTATLLFELLKTRFECSALIGDGFGVGNPNAKYFILEACEYKDTFLQYQPDYSIITNIELEHIDYYKNMNHLIESFKLFMKEISRKIILNDSVDIQAFFDYEYKIIDGGLVKNSFITLLEVRDQIDGFYIKILFEQKEYEFSIPLYGKHNLNNFINAMTCALYLSVPIERILERSTHLYLPKRRFEQTSIHQLILVNDYAHHPTEIKALFDALSHQYPDKKKVIIFQPHTFSRTQYFYHDFIKVLDRFDDVYIVPIFGSIREKDNKNHDFEYNFNMFLKYETDFMIENYMRSNAIICFCGAGDIDKDYMKLVTSMKKFS